MVLCGTLSAQQNQGHNHNHSSHDHSGHDHSGHNHDHSGHDHSGHDHSKHDHAAHKKGGKHITNSNNHSNANAAHGGHDDHGHGASGEFDPKETIMHHIADAHEFHLVGSKYLPLPIILYVPGEGLKMGLSSSFKGAGKDGFKIDHGALVATSGREKANIFNLGKKDVAKYFDFSITKNVFTMFLAALALLGIFFTVAAGYRKRDGQSPKGLQSFMEPFFVFIRDEVAKPNIPEKWEKYLPYLMTLFFFILACNLFGLIPFFPGSANVTGNIAFTATLALFTLIITSFSGNKHYWQHIFWMPGVPVLVKPILAVVEFAGVFIKPFSLMIRLFANMSGGHIIILSLVSLIFIFGKMGASMVGAGAGIAVSVPFTLFINAIELFVAFLQAFIFTILSALYIGQAVEEAHDHH